MLIRVDDSVDVTRLRTLLGLEFRINVPGMVYEGDHFNGRQFVALLRRAGVRRTLLKP